MGIIYLKDNDLAVSLKSGDSSAFESLLDIYGSRILKLCFLILKDEALAEDAVQEVFEQVYKSIRKFRGKAALYTWIYRIAVNKCRDILKKRNEYISLDESADFESDIDLEGQVLERAGRERIRNAVFSLPHRYREIVILFYFEDLPIKDICMILNESEGTVKSKLHRARNILKGLLKEEELEYGKR